MGIFDFLFKKSLSNYELKYKEAERKYFQNDYESAIVDLKGLISEYPHYQCYGLMGSCYFGLKKYKEALTYYKKSIEKEPSVLKNSMAHERIETIEEILLRLKANVELNPKEGNSIFDFEGNSYKTIIINNQKWTAENLRTTKFRNGDLIPQASTSEEWERAGNEGKPAWCYYDNKTSNGETYGKLYNWHAVIDQRGLAPEGSHIPSIDEWNKFSENIGQNGGHHLKSPSGWKNNGNGTNKSWFNGLPGGYRYGFAGEFYSIGLLTGWWSSSKGSENYVWSVGLNDDSQSLKKGEDDKNRGHYVRCIVDQ